VHHDHPAEMPIDDGLEELTALLAAGFLRLKRRRRVRVQGGEFSAPDTNSSPCNITPRTISARTCGWGAGGGRNDRADHHGGGIAIMILTE
jgi:hypothetical protein